MNEETWNGELIDGLAAEFTERHRRGEKPSVEEYAAKHPALADDIRELFPMILQVEQAKEADSEPPASASAAYATPPSRLGDFRIIRELGRGGMGIVYEAEQESLGRRVAIKVLPQQHLANAARRERFEREARTAAGLHHTNIVQIFGVGQQEGHPYFVMQYIRGVGLDAVFTSLANRSMIAHPSPGRRTHLGIASSDLVQVARDLLDSQTRPTGAATAAAADSPTVLTGGATDASEPGPCSVGDPTEGRESTPVSTEVQQQPDESAYWRNLARLFAQATDALSFAHSQGVLHRDVKPANLLLDADGMLWVTDFGLAKAAEQQELTQTGDVIGTLCYMAPEQFEGKGDERSDIYGLGITLYEMATLRPAFVQGGRSSVIKAILEEPLFPPRRLCPSMSHDLETIILKAAAREPQHRYASAAEFRDDLIRFVEDRPIQARRTSVIERSWRWSRRNPALAATTGLAIGLLVSVAVVSSAAYLKVRAANAVTQTALAAETQQRRRAEGTADLAVNALDTIFDEFTPAGRMVSREVTLGNSEEDALVVSVPSVLSPETAAFLNGLLRFYRGLAQQDSNSSALLLKMAAAQCRVGEIYGLLGQFGDAKAAYADAVSQYETLRRTSPGDTSIEVALARVNNRLGQVYSAEDEAPQARSCFDSARRLLQARIDAGDVADETRFELARSCYLLSRPIGANTPVFDLQRGPGRPPGSEPSGRAGERPRGDRPPGPRLGERRPPSQELGLLPPWPPPPGPPLPGEPGERRGPGRLSDEDRAYRRRAIEILTLLSNRNPAVPEYRHLLGQCLCQPGGPPWERLQGEEGDAIARGVTILEKLVAEFPSVPQYQFDLSEAYAVLARRPGSIERLERAAEILRTLADQWPHVPSYRFSLAHMHLRLSFVRDREGQQPELVLAELRRAVELQTELVRQFPTVATYAMMAAYYESAMAEQYERQLQDEQARALLESAAGRMDSLAAVVGYKPHVRWTAMRCYEQLARVYERLGETKLSQDAWQRAEAMRLPPSPLAPPDRPSDRLFGVRGPD